MGFNSRFKGLTYVMRKYSGCTSDNTACFRSKDRSVNAVRESKHCLLQASRKHTSAQCK